MRTVIPALSLVLAMTLSAQQPARVRTPPRPAPAPAGSAIATTTPGLLCSTGCPSTSMLLLFVNSEGRCSVPVRFSCFPYRCEPAARACKTDCVSSGDCAAGAVCNLATAECAPIGYQCKDAFTVQASDGTSSSCSPYRCVAGACQSTCSGNLDCADPSKCSNGLCVDPKRK
jgi:hypothetical protein